MCRGPGNLTRALGISLKQNQLDLTKGPLRYDREKQELVSEKAKLAYPVRDGIPIMLAEEARPLGDDE